MPKKENKKFLLKLIIPLAIILLLILGWLLFLNIWTVKPSNDINAITLSVLSDGGYSTVFIVNDKEISKITEMVLKLQNEMNITNMKAVRAVEKYQKDPEFEVTFDYGDGFRFICIHKNTVVIFNENRTHFLELENMNTENLINILNSYSA